ncbi:hypothetical protein EON66_05555 [archaeon]|nr:MAG: hypothetical protein EON66_05555 [archaeon]
MPGTWRTERIMSLLRGTGHYCERFAEERTRAHHVPRHRPDENFMIGDREVEPKRSNIPRYAPAARHHVGSAGGPTCSQHAACA